MKTNKVSCLLAAGLLAFAGCGHEQTIADSSSSSNPQKTKRGRGGWLKDNVEMHPPIPQLRYWVGTEARLKFTANNRH